MISTHGKMGLLGFAALLLIAGCDGGGGGGKAFAGWLSYSFADPTTGGKATYVCSPTGSRKTPGHRAKLAHKYATGEKHRMITFLDKQAAQGKRGRAVDDQVRAMGQRMVHESLRKFQCFPRFR